MAPTSDLCRSRGAREVDSSPRVGLVDTIFVSTFRMPASTPGGTHRMLAFPRPRLAQLRRARNRSLGRTLRGRGHRPRRTRKGGLPPTDARDPPSYARPERAEAASRYWPRKLGLRFSRNAATPSRRSSVRKHAANASTSISLPSPRVLSSPSRIHLFERATATGPLSRSAGRSFSPQPATVAEPPRDSRDRSSASWCVDEIAVLISSRAIPTLTRRARRWVPPKPGMIPEFYFRLPRLRSLRRVR